MNGIQEQAMYSDEPERMMADQLQRVVQRLRVAAMHGAQRIASDKVAQAASDAQSARGITGEDYSLFVAGNISEFTVQQLNSAVYFFREFLHQLSVRTMKKTG